MSKKELPCPHCGQDIHIPARYNAENIAQLEATVQAAVDYFEDGITSKEQLAAYGRFVEAVQPFLTKETNDG